MLVQRAFPDERGHITIPTPTGIQNKEALVPETPQNIGLKERGRSEVRKGHILLRRLKSGPFRN